MVADGEGEHHGDDEDLAKRVSGTSRRPRDGARRRLTRVRLFETCLRRIVHTDSPLAPSTVLGPWCCRRRAASAPSSPCLRRRQRRARFGARREGAGRGTRHILKVGPEQSADIGHGVGVGRLGREDGSGVNGAGDRATADCGVGIGSPGDGRGWSAGYGILEAAYRRLRLPLDVKVVLCPHSIECVAVANPAIHAAREGKGGKSTTEPKGGQGLRWRGRSHRSDHRPPPAARHAASPGADGACAGSLGRFVHVPLGVNVGQGAGSSAGASDSRRQVAVPGLPPNHAPSTAPPRALTLAPRRALSGCTAVRPRLALAAVRTRGQLLSCLPHNARYSHNRTPLLR